MAEVDPEVSDRMERVRRFSWFVTAMLFLDMVGFVLGALLAPPDAYAQLLVLAPTLLLAPIGAYWLVYRGGYARLRGNAAE